MRSGYVIKVTTDYPSGLRTESYIMRLTPFCTDLTCDMKSAGIWPNKKTAQLVKSAYLKRHGHRRNERVEVIGEVVP